MRVTSLQRFVCDVVFFLLSAGALYAQPPEAKEYRLVWHDEFDGPAIDSRKWSVRSPGKRGDAFNDMSAISFDDNGCLIIEASHQHGRLQSAMIHTEDRFSVTYGYFECRAKLNRVPGLWCSFWLQSSGNQTNSIPEKDGAEIDIFEYFPHARTDAVSHSIHWGGYTATHRVAGPVYSVLPYSADGFHVFGLLWTPEGYKVFVDGKETHQAASAVSGAPEFIVLSLEANNQVAGPLKPEHLPDRFVVDYVRVYQR